MDTANVFQIVMMIMGFILSVMTAVLTWQHHEIRDMTSKQITKLERELDEMRELIHAHRLEVEQTHIKKDDYWVDIAGQRRLLEEVSRKIDKAIEENPNG